MLDSAVDGKNKLDFSKLKQNKESITNLKKTEPITGVIKRDNLLSSVVVEPNLRVTVVNDTTRKEIHSRTLSEQAPKVKNLTCRSLQDKSLGQDDES